MANPSFSLTRNQIIRQALLMLGAIEASDTASAQEVSDATIRLNAILNDEIAPFGSIFSIKRHDHTLTPGTESYSVGSGKDIDIYRPFGLIAAYRTSSSSSITEEYELTIEPRQSYMRLPTKGTQAPPVSVYYHPGTSEGTLYVWPTGTSTWDKLILDFQRPLSTLDAASDTLDLPQEWHHTVITLLAEDLAPDYLGGIPQWLMQKAQLKRNKMLIHDTEDESIFLQPDIRSY